MTVDLQLVQAIKAARLRHESYVANCSPVDELDEQGRTQDMAVADRVLAYFGLKVTR